MLSRSETFRVTALIPGAFDEIRERVYHGRRQ